MCKLAKGKRYTDEELSIINDKDFLFKCSVCGIEKPNSDFYKTKRKELNRGRFYTSHCKLCNSKYRKDGYSSSDKRRKYMVKRDFGLEWETYQNMFEKQGGCCAICGIPESSLKHGKTKRLSVDHDHQTGDVRGLLCYKCNTAIGMLSDSIDLVEKSLNYLKKYEKWYSYSGGGIW